MESTGAYVDDCFMLGFSVFRTALPHSGADHLEKGGMLLDDAVGVSCE